MYKNTYKKREPKIECPTDCKRCKEYSHCYVRAEIDMWKRKLKKAETTKEKENIQEILDVLLHVDTADDLKGKKDGKKR